MKKKILFIINPISGKGKQRIVAELIPKHLDLNLFDYEIAFTDYPHHATEISIKAIQSGFETIVAVGGDGSINEVAKALVNTSAKLAIIPMGSGNGLARHLRIPLKIELAIELINKYKTNRIDTALFNEHFFVCAAGVGFDAHISHLFAKQTKRGFSTYIKIILKEFFSYREQMFEIKSENVQLKQKAFLVGVSNSSQWGNDAWISPNASTSDGELNVFLLRKPNLFQMPVLSYKLLNKKIESSSLYQSFKSKELSITQPFETAHVDGEPITSGKEIKIKIIPQSLTVICNE